MWDLKETKAIVSVVLSIEFYDMNLIICLASQNVWL